MKNGILTATAAMIIVAGCSGAGADDQSAMVAGQESGDAAAPEAEPSVAGPNLDTVLTFKNASICEWGDAAESIFEQKVTWEGDVLRPGQMTIAGIAEPVTAKLSRPDKENPDYVEAQLDFMGEWHGLQVVGLTDAFFEESGGVFGRGIRFDAPVADVTAALAAAGFNVNADGSERAFVPDQPGQAVNPDDFMGEEFVMTSVTAEGEETVFNCNYIFAGI